MDHMHRNGIFHRDIKSHLGLEDVSAHDFSSVEAHVLWVYAAYAFLRLECLFFCCEITDQESQLVAYQFPGTR